MTDKELEIALERLVKDGLVNEETIDGVKYYSLTALGKMVIESKDDVLN